MKFDAKKLLKRFLCCALAVLALVLPTSCAKDEDYTKYGSDMKEKVFYGVDNDGKLVHGSVMTPGMFNFFLSEQKSTFLLTFMYNDPTITGDSEEIWQRIAPDGKTYEEKFFGEVVKSAKELVAANTLLYMMPSAQEPDKTYTLPSDYVEYVKSLVLKNAAEKYGSVMDFEAYLANFSATIEDYTALYLMTANIDLLKEALFNNNGYVFTDAEFRDYYEKNYYCANHIYVNTAADTKIDGTLSPLDQEESAKREALAKEIELFIKSGGNMQEAKEMYTESFVQVYENVAEMDINNTTANAPELGEALKKLRVGETVSAKSAYGVHIIKRVETVPENFARNEKTLLSIKSALSNTAYSKLLEEQSSRVSADENLLSSFSMKDAVLP